ncbi:hypothetical protein [Vibrio parahaemolyticus]|uniref:hypothetical protein n=1 Tax=Vibrio parahaemolyticus TaxID=670 RepID=UPI00235EB70B|nr:hypothetical protein [Vibrio parahaemolyticus]
MSKLIEIKFEVEPISTENAILESEKNGPTHISILPIRNKISGGIDFRVAFEPLNNNRRQQPYRNTIKDEFPDGWKIGDPYPL